MKKNEKEEEEEVAKDSAWEPVRLDVRAGGWGGAIDVTLHLKYKADSGAVTERR